MTSPVTFPELLDTARLRLRRYTRTDAPGVLELVNQNRGRLIQNFSQMAKGISKLEDAISFIEDKATLWDATKIFAYGIWRKSSAELIGQLQVKNIVWDVPSAELSYFISSSSLRQGFATEAISVILDTAFELLEFKRIFLRIVASNQESILLARKLGFQHEGLHRSEFRCGLGELHDVHYFSLTLDDYKTGVTRR
jgi:RimJ/RimL family protein N-acetyltransferase